MRLADVAETTLEVEERSVRGLFQDSPRGSDSVPLGPTYFPLVANQTMPRVDRSVYQEVRELL